MKEKVKNPTTLSAKEVELITRLEFEGKDVYTREDIVSFCIDRQKAAYLIKKLLVILLI